MEMTRFHERPTITPVLVADLLAEGERMPVYVHVIDHPDARVLVDTGMTELHPAVADMDPRLHSTERAGLRPRRHRHRRQHAPALRPLRRQPPLRRQADLRPAPGARRRAQRGRLHHPRVGRRARRAVRAGRRRARAASRAPARPGAGPHARACRWSSSRPAGGRSSSAATWRSGSASSTSRSTEGQLRVRALDPELVWLAHEHEPWRPRIDWLGNVTFVIGLVATWSGVSTCPNRERGFR